MSGNYVINIGRQLGSGGKEIGEKLAARLGIDFYDKELINLASEESGLCKELKLIIRINRYDISQVCYEIIFDSMFNIGINKSTTIYQQCISTLHEVVSFLEF